MAEEQKTIEEEKKSVLLGHGEVGTYLAALVDWKNKCLTQVASSQNNVRRNLLYVYDQHYAKIEGKGRDQRFRQADLVKYPTKERHYTNEMGRVYFDNKSIVLQNTPLIQVDPRSGCERRADVLEAARTAEAILLAYAGEDMWNLPMLLHEAVGWSSAGGVGWFKIVLRKDSPKVQVDTPSYFCVVPDPVATSWENMTRMFHEDTFHVDQVWEWFGDELTERYGMTGPGDLLSRKDRTPPGRAFINEYMATLPGGGVEAPEGLQDEQVTISEFVFLPPTAPEGKVVTLVEGLSVQDADFGFGPLRGRSLNPFVPIYWEKIQGTVQGRGMLEKLRTLQMRLNVSERKIHEKAQADLQIIASKLKLDKKFGEDVSIAGEVIRNLKIMYYSDEAPKPIDFKSSYQELMINSDKLIQKMKEVAGSRLPRAAESGKDRQLIGAEDEQRQDDPTTNLENAVKVLFRTGLHYSLDVEDTEYLARLAGTTPKKIALLRALVNDLEVKVVTGSARPRNRLATLLENIEIEKALDTMLPNARQCILRLSNLHQKFREADPEYPHRQRAENENALWEKGEDIEIHPLDNHVCHIRIHLEKRFEDNPTVDSFDRVKELDKHIIKHQLELAKKGQTNAEAAPNETKSEGGAGAGTILRSLALGGTPSGAEPAMPGLDNKLKG